jgi:hypothetical protein
VGDETQLQQSRQSLINFLTTHAQFFSHALSAVEGRAVSIGGQSEQDQYGCSLGAQSGEPSVVQQAILKPAEAAGGLSDEIGSGRRDSGLTHTFWSCRRSISVYSSIGNAETCRVFRSLTVAARFLLTGVAFGTGITVQSR